MEMMKLDPITPGRWRNPAWTPGSPGAFAVIIGVSSYKHLPGGTGVTAAQTYGLPQLAVSAYTAYSFFNWLSEEYSVNECPLAKVWLLLSPTDKEIAKAPTIVNNACDATFSNCSDAISECRNEMRALTAESGGKSRFFFLFSGHGLEKETDNQILLPSDYLAPPGENINQAISTGNLWKGLGALPVSRLYYFIDACRSDASELRDFDITGAPILAPSLAYRSNPDLVSPIQYATASGTTAWQPPDPARGISFFGQALIEGLKATPHYKPEPPCDILVYDLNRYITKRVDEMLSTGTERQRVRMGGGVADGVVTSVGGVGTPPAGPPPVAPVPGPPVGPAITAGVQVSTAINADFFKDLGAQKLEVSYASANENLLLQSALHSITDSERMEDLLRSVNIYSLTKREWLDPKSACKITKFERGEKRADDTPDRTRAYRLTVSFSVSADSYWLQVTDQKRRTACVLPGDIIGDGYYGHPVEFQIEIDLGPETAGEMMTVRRFEPMLALENHGWLGDAAKLWSVYRRRNAKDACEWFLSSGNPELAINILDGKMGSPLGATVAAILLIRARKFLNQNQELVARFPYLRAGASQWDWIGNLAKWFPYLSDGAVFWNEVLWDGTSTQIPGGHVPETVGRNFQFLASQILPYTVEAQNYLASQVEDAFQDSAILPPDALVERIKQARRFLLPTGLFATFSGPKEQITPNLIVPPSP
jgi:Caspase domain